MFAIWIHFCKSCIMLTSIVRKKYLTVTQTELQVATLKQRDRPCIFKLKSTTSVLPCKIARSINKLFCHVLLFQLTEHHFCRCLCLELKEKRITQSCILTLVKPKSGGWGGAWWLVASTSSKERCGPPLTTCAFTFFFKSMDL